MKKLFIIILMLIINSVKVNGLALEDIKETPESELKKGVEINQNIYRTDSKLISKIITNDKSFIVIGKNNAIEDEYYPYIALYENEKLQWEKTFIEKGEGAITDCIINDDLYIVMETHTDTFQYIYLIKMSLSGSIVCERCYYSAQGITAVGLHLYKNWVLLAGTTWSTTGFLSKYKSESSVYLASFLKEDLSEGLVTLYGNNGENLLLDYTAFNGEIYLKIRVDGDGYYNDGTNRRTFDAFFKCNYYTECDNYVPVNHYAPYIVSDIAVNPNNNNLIYASYTDGDVNIIYREYNSLLTNYNTHIYNLVIDRAKIIQMNSGVSDMLMMSYETDDEINVLVLNDDFTVRKKYQESLSELDTINYITSEDGVIYLLGECKGEIKCYRKAELKLKGTDCYINGKLVEGKKVSDYDVNTFGVYSVIYQYEVNGETFEIVKGVEVPLQINIVDQGTYDVGTILQFNGMAKLDYVPIESGYKIETEGLHFLELIGNNKKYIYSFVAKKSSVEVGGEIDDLNMEVEIQKDIPIINDSDAILNDMKIEYEASIINSNGVYITIFIGIFGLAVGMLLPLRRKR